MNLVGVNLVGFRSIYVLLLKLYMSFFFFGYTLLFFNEIINFIFFFSFKNDILYTLHFFFE